MFHVPMIDSRYIAMNGTLIDAFMHFTRRGHSKEEAMKLSYKWLAEIIHKFGIQLELPDEFFNQFSEILLFIAFLAALPAPQNMTVAGITESFQFQSHVREQLSLLLCS
jgi:hypothetical protein